MPLVPVFGTRVLGVAFSVVSDINTRGRPRRRFCTWVLCAVPHPRFQRVGLWFSQVPVSWGSGPQLSSAQLQHYARPLSIICASTPQLSFRIRVFRRVTKGSDPVGTNLLSLL